MSPTEATETETPTPGAGVWGTAVEPSRVLVLDESEQHMLIAVLGVTHASAARANLYGRIARGEEYLNAADELTRRTLRKRRLEAEIRRENKRIEELNEVLVEQWAQDGQTGFDHAETGARLKLKRDVWAKLNLETVGMTRGEEQMVRADFKAETAPILAQVGLGHFIKEDFNLQTLSAHFREQIRAYDDEQRSLPEHERVPKPANDFVPEQLRPYIRIDDKPQIQVRA